MNNRRDCGYGSNGSKILWGSFLLCAPKAEARPVGSAPHGLSYAAVMQVPNKCHTSVPWVPYKRRSPPKRPKLSIPAGFGAIRPLTRELEHGADF